MYRLGRYLSRVTDMTTLVGGLAIALMMVHISLDVLLRYLFSTPIPGTITYVSNYYMIVAAFLPLAYAEKLGAHISVEVVTERLPQRIQFHLAHWLILLSAIILGFMAVKTWLEAVTRYEMGAALVEGGTSIIIWPGYFVLPIGLGLMVLMLVYKFVVYLTGGESGLVSSGQQQGTGEVPRPNATRATGESA
ncbi:TRAP transporter small permease [Alloalcanivorax xenomutans]|uniref:TRAP transporter small permease n=1 Tax=Alloalcanivorax xenomutans TaxID=1094342 RepID=UPI0003B82F66|nr:TRAP transporter small permease [Alloalcanivorax xenomutans]ERS11359.1 C4-dicarboxylate ABC transporter substrate-binding protein [Alcanivorax sp. PN-3]WOA31635.1 TRAP transporter small permease [Alloalcanivorax xenomutans]|tara:strand:+ start:1570 stop:2145 length:576 start_codon:yes stop_codon:yes gene_type:complete